MIVANSVAGRGLRKRCRQKHVAFARGACRVVETTSTQQHQTHAKVSCHSALRTPKPNIHLKPSRKPTAEATASDTSRQTLGECRLEVSASLRTGIGMAKSRDTPRPAGAPTAFAPSSSLTQRHFRIFGLMPQKDRGGVRELIHSDPPWDAPVKKLSCCGCTGGVHGWSSHLRPGATFPRTETTECTRFDYLLCSEVTRCPENDSW